MSRKEVTFKMTIEEANLIFKALGGLPFSDVYEVIGKLNEQANIQLKESNMNGSNILSNGKIKYKG